MKTVPNKGIGEMAEHRVDGCLSKETASRVWRDAAVAAVAGTTGSKV